MCVHVWRTHVDLLPWPFGLPLPVHDAVMNFGNYQYCSILLLNPLSFNMFPLYRIRLLHDRKL